MRELIPAFVQGHDSEERQRGIGFRTDSMLHIYMLRESILLPLYISHQIIIIIIIY